MSGPVNRPERVPFVRGDADARTTRIENRSGYEEAARSRPCYGTEVSESLLGAEVRARSGSVVLNGGSGEFHVAAILKDDGLGVPAAQYRHEFAATYRKPATRKTNLSASKVPHVSVAHASENFLAWDLLFEHDFVAE